MVLPYLKKATGVTGLKVARNPDHVLRVLYAKIMRTLQKIPPEAAYRRYTEEIVTNRMKILEEAKSMEEVEEKINCGQVEEIIIQAENELLLSRRFLSWKPWEPLTEEPLADQWKWPPSQGC